MKDTNHSNESDSLKSLNWANVTLLITSIITMAYMGLRLILTEDKSIKDIAIETSSLVPLFGVLAVPIFFFFLVLSIIIDYMRERKT